MRPSDRTPQIPPDRALAFTLNGKPVSFRVPANRALVDLLRECGLTGTKEGCGIGVCGSCSVLVNGRLLSSCLMLALQVDGASVETVEGLTATGEAGALQESFVACGGFQCGICTPGQIVAATALLRECGAPQEDDVKRWMTGNICRCTGYYQIVEAVRVAAGASRG